MPYYHSSKVSRLTSRLIEAVEKYEVEDYHKVQFVVGDEESFPVVTKDFVFKTC